jgi:hypothetical protein
MILAREYYWGRRQAMRTAVAILSIMVLANIPLHGATTTLAPMADTTLQSAFANNNIGGETSLWVGGRRQGGAARGLLRFDLSSVPAGATINSVTLTLNCTRSPSGGVSSLFDLHRVLEAWGEGNNDSGGRGTLADANEATWNNRLAPGTPWTTAGGTFSATVSASRSVSGAGAYTFSSTAGLVSDVQTWVNNSSGNFGWELISESEGTPTTIRRFGSRTDAVSAPSLLINYTPVPEPGTLALVAVGGLSLCFVMRQHQKRKGE